MKPNVGLTVLTSSFMILLTMVVFPALSRPLLPLVRGLNRRRHWVTIQHQNSHFLILEPSLAEN